MDQLYWLAAHDLSLTLDGSGRLWRFRPTAAPHGRQPVDAHLERGDVIAVTVAVPDIATGDVRLHTRDRVLEIRGTPGRTADLACDIGLPAKARLDALETSFAGGVMTIRVPLAANRATAPAELPVAV